VEENVRQIGRDHLDLVNLRTLSVSKPVGEHFAALAALRDAGLVRHLGLSNLTVEQIDEALVIASVVAVQNRYSIDSRCPEADDVVAAFGKRGISFVPFFAIAGEGREGGRRTSELEPVLAIARAHGATPAQVRLAWTLARGSHVLAIPGTGRLTHLDENVAAGAVVGRPRHARRARPARPGTATRRLPRRVRPRLRAQSGRLVPGVPRPARPDARRDRRPVRQVPRDPPRHEQGGHHVGPACSW
jgi:aryl-alcohol dehydrogenase-like predicted oxidoreductase